MCGIVGQLGGSCITEGVVIRTMASSLSHRGPDDFGIWSGTPDEAVQFAHRRLSVIDLSPAGHQPMLSMCGRYVITFNGEIYNYQEIR